MGWSRSAALRSRPVEDVTAGGGTSDLLSPKIALVEVSESKQLVYQAIVD
jgi:hypothetical protein